MRQSITFKEWMPDQPDLGGGYLGVAKNVLPTENGYIPFRPFDASMATVPSSSTNGIQGSFVAGGATKGSEDIYAMAGVTYYELQGSAFTARGAASAMSSSEMFTQIDNLIVGVNRAHVPMRHTLGSSSNFAALSADAPRADVCGTIGQFLVLGNFYSATGNSIAPHAVQWSGVDAPTSWPTPNSATAIAQQSGYQELPLIQGAVHAIHGGDQFGVILQERGVNRMTYVGPPVVFQFDVIDNVQGLWRKRASVKAGALTYFLSIQGFCRTDGVSVERIGAGKVDRFFWDNYTTGEIVAGYDPVRDHVYWAYSNSTSGSCDKLLIFSPITKSWAYAENAIDEIVTPQNADGVSVHGLYAFGATGDRVLGKFEATAGSAVFETCDAEFNPGGRTYVDGIKPNIESSATAPAVTVRLGTRNDLGTTPSYTSATTANAETGFAHFRSDAKYHRAEVTITGNFNRTTGIVANARPSGQR